jgi:signal transduction histidine kinase
MLFLKTTSFQLFKSLKRVIIIFSALFFGMNTIYSQKNVRDSLTQLVHKTTPNNSLNIKDTVHINLLNILGEHLRFYKADSLLRVAEQALKHSRTIDYTIGRINALNNIGDYYSDKGNHNKAIQNFQSAFEIANELESINLMLYTQNRLANQYTINGDYEKALKEYLTGIEIATLADHKHMLSIIYENIALLYAGQEDFEQALVYFKIVNKLNEEIGDDILIACTTSNMAVTYADMGNLEYAMFHITKSITVFEKHELMDWLAFAFEVKGKTYLKQGKFKWAIFWYNQSQSLHKKNVEDERSEINLLNGIAEANFGLEKDSISEKYAKTALEISTRLKEKKGIKKSAEILYKVSKKRNDYLNALNYHELFQKLSDTMSNNSSKRNLLMLKARMDHEDQKKTLVEDNQKALAKQKNYVYASVAILLILMVITLIVRRNEKIQKNLNRELQSKTSDLEKNEVELRAINETKDKMFSIIGHDLRGPIGAFQGLLQLLKNGEIDQNEFIQFVPKLRSDIDNISFTLNNLLSWGQTQMNGTITQPSIISLEHLVKDNINLLSEIAGAKSIKMVSQLNKNTMAWSDVDQIDIVIRNLMSNALKFTPKNGMVTIDAEEKKNFWEISVRDTGVGIEKEIKDKIFGKNSNLTTYGTENEKGTGLGLSLCKEMVENNNGTIWVESVPKKGTCFYFTVPKSKKTFKKAS